MPGTGRRVQGVPADEKCYANPMLTIQATTWLSNEQQLCNDVLSGAITDIHVPYGSRELNQLHLVLR